MLFSDLLRAVVLRWRLELAIVLAMMGVAGAWIWKTPRSYVASATLLFDDRAPDPTAADGATKKDLTGTLSTEAQILHSDAVARTVVDKLGLAQRPDVRARWQEETGGAQSLRYWLASGLLSGLSADPAQESNVISVNYESKDPVRAAELANAFADSFVRSRLEMSKGSANTYGAWFARRIREARQRLEAAQSALSNFQRSRGIISTGTIDAESTRLGELSSQLSGAEGLAADASARARAGGSAMPEVQSSGVVQGLRAQIATKSAEIQQLGSELGPRHPLMVAAAAELAALKTKLASEIGTTSSTLAAASAAAQAREAQVRALLDKQRARMLSLAADRGRLQVMEKDVETAAQEYQTVTQQSASMQVRGSVPALNVRVLDRAEPPLLPSSPNIGVRFLMMTLVGIMLAVAVAVLLEWMRPRIRSHAALIHLTGAPVLGSADVPRIGQVLRLEKRNG